MAAGTISRSNARLGFIAVLLFAAPLLYPQSDATYIPLPPGVPGVVYTPQIQLGSVDRPAIVTVQPIIQRVLGLEPEPQESNAIPASTELLSTRHFDFVAAPFSVAQPGSMGDTSISLGEYARKLRAERQNQPKPDVITNPDLR